MRMMHTCSDIRDKLVYLEVAAFQIQKAMLLQYYVSPVCNSRGRKSAFDLFGHVLKHFATLHNTAFFMLYLTLHR